MELPVWGRWMSSFGVIVAHNRDGQSLLEVVLFNPLFRERA